MADRDRRRGVMEVEDRTLSVWGGRIDLGVQVAGSGPPLVYLHAAAGLAWDPFLLRLAERYTVYAPQVPGTTPGRPDEIREVDDLWDLVLVYEEALRALGLDRPPVVGQSFGGMLACELAASFPRLFSRLVLLAPVGLWRDDAPLANWIATAPEDMAQLLFHHPESEIAQAALALPADPEAIPAAIAAATWTLGCTAKFLWPLPEKGLDKRLHRIDAPTLVVWGREDRLVSVVYAEEFGRRIAGARVEILEDSGHIPQAEQLEETFALVSGFLAA